MTELCEVVDLVSTLEAAREMGPDEPASLEDAVEARWCASVLSTVTNPDVGKLEGST